MWEAPTLHSSELAGPSDQKRQAFFPHLSTWPVNPKDIDHHTWRQRLSYPMLLAYQALDEKQYRTRI